jgi:hypothetical protein
VECSDVAGSRRVVRWKDLSGKRNDAVAPEGKKGPLCGVDAGAFNGRPVIAFLPDPADRTDGYLEVSLAALVKKPFTVAIVERRKDLMRPSSWVLGSKLPYREITSCMVANPNAGKGLRFGYNGMLVTVSTWGPMCDLRTESIPVWTDETKTAIKPTVSVLTFAPEMGLSLAVDDRPVVSKPAGGLDEVMTGFIGRAYQAGAIDDRYSGQIAEIAAWDVALTDQQRISLRQYLRDTWDTAP